ILLLGAAQPVRLSQDVLVQAGTYYHFEFGILGTGRLSGNLSELQDRSFDLFVFDDAGYASFRDGSNTVAPLLERSGTRIVFNLSLGLRTISRGRRGRASAARTPSPPQLGRRRLENRRRLGGDHRARRGVGSRGSLSDAECLVMAPRPGSPNSVPRASARFVL